MTRNNPDNTNVLLLVGKGVSASRIWTERNGGSIGAYSRSPGIYKGPSDKSHVLTSGEQHARVRSYQMNFYFGYAQSSGSVGDPFCQFLKLSDFEARGKPAQTFVFLDIHEDSIAGAAFQPFMPHGGPLVVAQVGHRLEPIPRRATWWVGDFLLWRWACGATQVGRSANQSDVWWVQDRASTQTLPVPP